MSFIANAGLLTVLVSLLFHLLPSPLDPYPWKHAFDLPSWGQDWAVNTQLKGADLALENELQGPESFAFHPLNGDVYTGVTGGLVYRIDANATNLEPIFFVGGSSLLLHVFHCGKHVLGLIVLIILGYLSDCSGNGLNQIDLLSYCQQQTKVKLFTLKEIKRLRQMLIICIRMGLWCGTSRTRSIVEDLWVCVCMRSACSFCRWMIRYWAFVSLNVG